MRKINLKANNKAKLRTKNRVRDNGPTFFLEKELTDILNFEGKVLLVRSEKTDWFGWLPSDELEITEG